MQCSKALHALVTDAERVHEQQHHGGRAALACAKPGIAGMSQVTPAPSRGSLLDAPKSPHVMPAARLRRRARPQRRRGRPAPLARRLLCAPVCESASVALEM